VTVGVDNGSLRVEIRDDGTGGALAAGPGLVGMQDRLEAFEGRLDVVSPPGVGTIISATIPRVRDLATAG
jgi:signal transduction histidine kinase